MPKKMGRKKKEKVTQTYGKLTTEIKKLIAKDKKDTVYLNYAQQSANLLPAFVNVFHLTNTQAWIPIFGTDANDGEGNKITYKGLGMDLYFRSFSETSNVTFTVFLVSLTDLIGQNFNVATGALGLTAGFHYYYNDGMVLLNKKCFTIHNRKRFQLGNHGTVLTAPSAQMQYGSEKRIYMKVSKNQVYANPFGNWKDIQAQLDPNKNMYLLVFTNDTNGDEQAPALNINTVHTVQKNI